MNFAQFLQLLKRSQRQSLYLLAGNEDYLRRQAIREIVEHYVDKDQRQLNFASFGDSSEEVSSALAAAMTWPMGSPHRVVHLCGPGLCNKPQAEMLSGYFQRPAVRAVLVLETEEIRKDSPLLGLANAHGTVVDCPRLRPHEYTAWLQQHARTHGFVLLPDACASLVSRVGNSLQELIVNLEKVFDYIGEPGKITRRHVLDAVGESREQPLWELSDAVTRGDASTALNIMDSCLRQGQPELLLLAVISKVFRQVLLAKELLRVGGDEQEVGRNLRIPDFKLADFIKSVKAMPEEWAQAMYAEAAKTDNLIKSSSTPPRILMEALVCRAASGCARQTRKHQGDSL